MKPPCPPTFNPITEDPAQQHYTKPIFVDFLEQVKGYRVGINTNSYSHINSKWLVDSGRQFLPCYTSKYLHLDEHTTSRAESDHWHLKRNLPSPQVDILTAMLSFYREVSLQYARIRAKIANQEVHRRIEALVLAQKVLQQYQLLQLRKLWSYSQGIYY
jgi:hypothetical protein